MRPELQPGIFLVLVEVLPTYCKDRGKEFKSIATKGTGCTKERIFLCILCLFVANLFCDA